MRIWYIWEGDINGEVPGTYEIKRLRDIGTERGHDIRILSAAQFKIIVGGCAHKNVFIDSVEMQHPDVIMSRMGAASSYLSISIIRHMERQGVMVINSANAIESAIDKMLTMQILAEKNIPIPKTMFAKCPIDGSVVTKEIGYPVIVKTLKGTQGGGVFLCENVDSLRDLSEILVHQGADDSPVLFQEFVASSRGTDIRAFCVGGKVVGCMKRQSTDGSFKSNITRGGVGEPVPVTADISRIALGTCEALGLEVAGIDLLFTEDGYKVCEANSAPDFKGLEHFCHVDIPAAIYDYIEDRYKRERGGNSVVTMFKKWWSPSKRAA